MTNKQHTGTGDVIDTTTGEIETIRPFADWLREQSGGTSHDELSESLHDLIARVRDTGKKGSLAYIVTVEPMKEDQDVLVVSDNINLKLPEFPRKASIFYADKNGNLVRSNPNQPEFEGLRDVSADPATDPTTLKDAR